MIATEIPWMRKELNMLKRAADRWSDGTVCRVHLAKIAHPT